MENTRLDSELPSKMASLDLLDPTHQPEDIACPHSENIPLRRTLRRKVEVPSIVTNRRVILKPQKRQIAQVVTEEEIKNYYTNKIIKTTSKTLETIFEEPRTINNDTLLIGLKKIKRSLTFPLGSCHSKDKIKKRRSKIKRLLGNKNFANRKKVTMQTFLKKMNGLEADETSDESSQISTNINANK